MGENASTGKGFAESSRDEKLDVYIWDMDETLILLKSLLTGTYAEGFNGVKNVQEGVEIGKNWEKQILSLCDDHFFYEQIENHNKPYLDVLSRYDDGRNLSEYDFSKDEFGASYDDDNKRKLAYRHRVIAQRYKQGLQSFLNQETKKDLDELYDMTDNYTDRWLSSAHGFLEECSVGNGGTSIVAADGLNDSSTTKCIHLLVTSGSLIPSLVKCLLFRLDNMIAHENVYSSWEVGKLQCFQWIKARFNDPKVRFCVIGDGWEEGEAAQLMQWPFIKIDMQPGSSHRFPGLTLRTVGFYFAVVYGNSDAEDEKE
ncbi:PREDICTED: eyes absent homolog 3 [Fragaria vesca subsp. vesca]|uniref:eyes absent homolog 3 n=1 Tax=Fragaria vesca subsp. vesca TaxID=101020 RepID=UPI0002C3535E|nr:PREDICTED: eyes absent homolog 3 [Fragaria vesca subsp. vesca]XP_011465163.1 PREDICTED: eyes absent homolog 3 [Fragaria vesca subsp. vesca]XP_011465164.1 PREDICTED: eyes absent homolog 3 [Fragaria vesca subsp. vesca]